MPAAAASGPSLLAFHHCDPHALDVPALVEQYERLRLRPLYVPETVRKHRAALRNVYRAQGEAGLFRTPPETVATDLYPHMSLERSRTMRRLTRQALEDFRAWFARR
jgi:hypothetical protein